MGLGSHGLVKITELFGLGILKINPTLLVAVNQSMPGVISSNLQETEQTTTVKEA